MAWRSPARFSRCGLAFPEEAGIGFTPHSETKAALLLENVNDAEPAGNPGTDVDRGEKLPVAAAVQPIAVEGQRDLEMPLLPGAEVADGGAMSFHAAKGGQSRPPNRLLSA